MNENAVIRVGEPLPVIASAEAVAHLTIRVQWKDGTCDLINILPMVERYKMLRPLKADADLFRSLKVSPHGTSIEWGEDMDISAVMLDSLARCQRVMTTEQFRSWLAERSLTLDAAAPALGTSRRTVASISTGERKMDLTMTLACAGYDARLKIQTANG